MRIVLPVLVAAALVAPYPAPAGAAALDLGPQVSAAIVRCWNPPAGATGSVTLRFDLGRDGRVVGTPRVNGLAGAGVASSAVHAVQFCQPYKLPPERYSDWQHVVVKLSVGGGR